MSKDEPKIENGTRHIRLEEGFQSNADATKGHQGRTDLGHQGDASATAGHQAAGNGIGNDFSFPATTGAAHVVGGQLVGVLPTSSGQSAQPAPSASTVSSSSDSTAGPSE